MALDEKQQTSHHVVFFVVVVVVVPGERSPLQLRTYLTGGAADAAAEDGDVTAPAFFFSLPFGGNEGGKKKRTRRIDFTPQINGK